MLKSNYFNSCNPFRRDFVCTHTECRGRLYCDVQTRVSEFLCNSRP